MPHLGRLVTCMECPHNLLIELVSAGRASMLAPMLHPAFDDEGLDDSAWLSDVFPNVPSDCAVALPHGVEVAKGRNEFSKSCGFNTILDLDKNRTTVVRRLDRYRGLRPMIRRCQIRVRILRETPSKASTRAIVCPTAATTKAVATLVRVASEPHRMLPPVIAP
jgi:hypothetical protein